ncbi:MAG TPA: sulfurtransferase [Candidatus Eisenbacteria bacterium]|nr:sulfurtransferase [Candidatus Eisenbacteria bacterium]
MARPQVPLLVSSEWLAGHLNDPGLRIADVRWSLLERDKGRNAYAGAHIPGAVFVDLDTELAAAPGQGPGRHPLPGAAGFAAAMSRAGVGPDTHVIAYDFGDGSTAARLWWLLRHFGHERVSLLDGGIARWQAEGRPLESRVPEPAPGSFGARPRPELVVDAEFVERARHDPRTLLLDTRARERYEGRLEPVDPAAGHIPGANSHPYAANVRSPEDPRFLPPAALRARFESLGAGRARRIVCYCGSGVNACQNVFALALAGFEDALLYEGSWSDWCSVPTHAVATGPRP